MSSHNKIKLKKNKPSQTGEKLLCGAECQNRTDHPQFTKLLLYQMS
jgi:hypothetical protein